MNRRDFSKRALTGLAALTVMPVIPAVSSADLFCGKREKQKSHYLTLSFDDGFRKSFYRIAEIHEEHGLHACLNVLASGHFQGSYENDILGNFDDWNRLKERGHEIMPHGWEHQNLVSIPFEQAKELVNRCLETFEKELHGFVRSKAVFNFPYNASNKEIEDFVLGKVRAVRTGGWNSEGNPALNPIPKSSGPVRIKCDSHGPDNADEWVEMTVNDFLSGEGGWLVLNLHGVDGEGWGPVTSQYLSGLLGRLVKIEKVAVMPAGKVLASMQNRL
jgi:peptidoglycan/xylan/chitin deacetylase (PgdA/CDA1 family)